MREVLFHDPPHILLELHTHHETMSAFTEGSLDWAKEKINALVAAAARAVGSPRQKGWSIQVEICLGFS